MYVVDSGDFCISKWAASTSDNTFYSSKNRAVSDRIGFEKIQDVVFEQFEGKRLQMLSISKKRFLSSS